MKAFDRGLEWIEKAICVLIFSALFAVASLQVISRYLFQHVFFWSEEAATFLFVWVIFFGASLVLRQGQHILISVFVSYLPARPRYAVLVAGDLAVLVALGIMVYYGTDLSLRSADIPSAAMGIPLTYLFAAVPVGALLMLPTALRILAGHVAAMVAETRGPDASQMGGAGIS